MMMVMIGMTREDKMMKLLLLPDILTKFVAAELLLADVDRSPQTLAWYKVTFQGLHGEMRQANRQNYKSYCCNCTRTIVLALLKMKWQHWRP